MKDKHVWWILLCHCAFLSANSETSSYIITFYALFTTNCDPTLFMHSVQQLETNSSLILLWKDRLSFKNKRERAALWPCMSGIQVKVCPSLWQQRMSEKKGETRTEIPRVWPEMTHAELIIHHQHVWTHHIGFLSCRVQ